MKAFFIRSACAALLCAGAWTQPALAQAVKDVNVVNTPNVHVASIPPVTVATPPRTPYQIGVVQQDWTTNTTNLIVEVPAGNRLVIEHVSASAFMHPQVELSNIALFTEVNNRSAVHVFTLPETAPGFTGSNTYSGGQSVRLYADQSFLVQFTKVSVGGPLTPGTASITVSGYLIPLASTTLGL